MYVGLAVDAVPGDWIVAEDHVVQHSDAVDLFIVFHVFGSMEDVVVAADQTLLAIETSEQGEVPAIDHAITKIIHLVIWTHYAVPVGDDSSIHLIRIIPRSHFGAICSQELANIGVTKVEI